MSAIQKIKISLFSTTVVVLGVVVFITGCVKESFDSSELDLTPDFHSGIASPVGYRTFTMDDFFDPHDQRTIRTDENGLLVLLYQSKIESPPLNEVFSIDNFGISGVLNNQSDQDIVLESIDSSFETRDTTWIEIAVSPQMNDSRISAILIEQLEFEISTTSAFDLNVSYQIEMPTLIKNSSNYKVALEANGSYSESIEGYTIHLKKHDDMLSAFPVVVHSVFYPSNTIIPANSEIIAYDVSFENVTYETMYGNFSGYTINLPADTIDLDIYESIPEGTFHFSQPEMTIATENSVGMPVGIDLSNFRAHTGQKNWQIIDGEGLPDKQNPWVYEYPDISAPDIMAIDSLTVLHDQWNFSEHSDLKPEQVSFESQLYVNPNFEEGEHFIHKDSKTSYILNLMLPLYGHARFLSLTDTMNFLISDFISKDYEQLEKAFFRFNVTNGFPITFGLQVYLANENFAVLDSLFDESQVILPASQNEEATEAIKSDPIIAEVDRATFEMFQQDVTHLISNVHIQTAGFSESSPTNVGIYKDQFLEINLGLVLDLKESSNH